MRTQQWEEGYEVGHREGESCRDQDWFRAFEDTLPESVDEDDPEAVAAWVASLLPLASALVKILTQDRGGYVSLSEPRWEQDTHRATVDTHASITAEEYAILKRLMDEADLPS